MLVSNEIRRPAVILFHLANDRAGFHLGGESRVHAVAPFQASKSRAKRRRAARCAEPTSHVEHSLVIRDADQAPIASTRHFPYTYYWKIPEMDTSSEKKWFVYVGDHHEGPFSLTDIKGK